MKTTHISRISHLGAVVGLSFALSACSGGSGGEDTSTGNTTGGSATDATTGTASMPTTDAATGTTGASSTPTTDVSGDTGSSSTPTTDGTTAPTTDGTGNATTEATSTTGATTEATTDGTSTTDGTTGAVEPSMSFFVSSTGSMTGNLGGLAGADKRCQDLATAVGAGDKTWHAYLSVEKGPGDQPVHARDRIGEGPWYNAKLVMLAADLAELHTLDGNYELFLDEHGEPVPGQWLNSPKPNQHDILTGSNLDGTVTPGKTCADWTSEDPTLFAQIGHSDGLGPMMNDAPNFRPWNSVHENGGCHDTTPKGGAGRVYCFAID